MVKTKTLVVAELFVCFLVGAGPVLVMYSLEGVEGIVTAMKSLLPPGPVLYFYAALTAVYFLFWLINVFVFPHHRRSKRFVLTMVHCFQQAGVSLLGAYRIITGVTLAAGMVWVLNEPETATWGKTGQLYWVAGLCFLVACVLSAMHMKLVARSRESLEKSDSDPFDL